MNKLMRAVGAAGPPVILVGALVALVASLAALFMASSLQAQLQSTQGQLEEAKQAPPEQQASPEETEKKTEAQEDRSRPGGAPNDEKQAPNTQQPGSEDSKQPSNANPQDQPQPPSYLSPDGGVAEPGLIYFQDEGEPGFFSQFVPYLLPAVLWLVVLISLALVVVSALMMLSRSRTRAPVRSERVTVPASGDGFVAPGAANGSASASPAEDGRWTKLVEDCVEVLDELDRHMESFDSPRREVAGHVMFRMEEILGRSGVEVIVDDPTFDRARHKAVPAGAATAPGAAISETVSPGFAVGRRVLRRARVRVE